MKKLMLQATCCYPENDIKNRNCTKDFLRKILMNQPDSAFRAAATDVYYRDGAVSAKFFYGKMDFKVSIRYENFVRSILCGSKKEMNEFCIFFRGKKIVYAQNSEEAETKLFGELNKLYGSQGSMKDFAGM